MKVNITSQSIICDTTLIPFLILLSKWYENMQPKAAMYRQKAHSSTEILRKENGATGGLFFGELELSVPADGSPGDFAPNFICTPSAGGSID